MLDDTYNLALKIKHEPYMYDTIRSMSLPSVYQTVYTLTTSIYKYSTIDYIEEEIKDSKEQ